MIEQLVPSQGCLSCEVCCRFNEAGSLMAPVFSAEEMAAAEGAGLPRSAFCHAGYQRSEPILSEALRAVRFRRRREPNPGGYLPQGRLAIGPGGAVRGEALDGRWTCPAFQPASRECRIYAHRPLDCQLYPFVLTCDDKGESVHLAADMACPFVVDNLCTSQFQGYAQRLAGHIDASLSKEFGRDVRFIAMRRPEFEMLHPLPGVTRQVCRPDLGLARLTPAQAPALQPYFDRADCRPVSHRALAPVLAWMDFFNLFYRVVDDRLLLFGEEGGAAFLWLPPVGTGPLAPAVEEALAILRQLGRQPDTWRIENVPEEDLAALEGLRLRAAERTEEFLYDREALVALAGRQYHGMKAACNFFVNHHEDLRFEPFADADIPEALALYRRWARSRVAAHPEAFYRAQIEASMLMHYRAMRQAEPLGLVGRTLRADGRLVGYTFGFPLPKADTAVVLIEVADVAVKGAGAYIFRESARSWGPMARLNTMGDSGLPNLRQAKLWYHPERLVPVYTVRPARGEAS